MYIKITLFFLLFSFNFGFGQVVKLPFADDSTKTEIEFEGYIIDTDTFMHGDYKKFYEYSNITYEEGSYKDNKKHGLFITYFENGKNHWVRSYKDGALFGNEEFYNSFGDLQFTGEYKLLKNNRVNYSQYYPNGKLKKTILLIDNKYDSEEITFFENGDTNSIKTFVKGKLKGPFIVKNPNQIITQKGSYKNGYLHGLLTTYYPDGKLKSYATFDKGAPHGQMQEYYKNKQLKRDCNYYHDTLSGKSVTYYPNGTLSSEALFYKGFFDKVYKEYWVNGKLKDSITYEKSLKNGESKHYDIDGNLLSIENFEKGVYHKKQLSYYASGQLKKDFTYNKGHKTGENYSFYENGKLESILVFDENDQIINQKKYHDNENLKSISKHKYKEFKNSDNKTIIKHTTKERNYYKTGEIKSEGKLLDDKKDGLWKFYVSKIELQEELKSKDSLKNYVYSIVKKIPRKALYETLTYKRDKKHGVSIMFFLNKRPKTKGNYVNNKKTGTWSEYFENGETASIKKYKNNLLHGEYIEYSKRNGTETIKGKYKKGKKEGTWTYKDNNNRTKKEKFIHGKLIDK